MHYIVIRQSQTVDQIAISEVVKRAYSSNVPGTFFSALFHEVILLFSDHPIYDDDHYFRSLSKPLCL